MASGIANVLLLLHHISYSHKSAACDGASMLKVTRSTGTTIVFKCSLTEDTQISYLLSNECFTVLSSGTWRWWRELWEKWHGLFEWKKLPWGYRVLKTDQLRIQWVSPKVLLQILMKFQNVTQKVSLLLNTECCHSNISPIKVIYGLWMNHQQATALNISSLCPLQHDFNVQ